MVEPDINEPFLFDDGFNPVELLNSNGSSDFVLTCEHAGRVIPASLGTLGIDPRELDRHIAYDIGAEQLSRKLAVLLDAPTILQHVSRLVIDCNRPLRSDECIVEASDGTVVVGNIGISPAERNARYHEIHQPFHTAVHDMLEERKAAGKPSVLISVHSFTRQLRSTGEIRNLDLGVLANRDPHLADCILETVGALHPGIIAGRNAPYGVDDLSDHTIPLHGEKRGIPHALLEIRNDQISTEAGQDIWADRLAAILPAALEHLRRETRD